MKFKTTQKAIKEHYNIIIAVPYCELQFLLKYQTPIAYTVQREGWAADIYDVDGICITEGYAPFGNIEPDYDTIRKYENSARQIYYKMPIEEGKTRLDALLQNFVNYVTRS